MSESVSQLLGPFAFDALLWPWMLGLALLGPLVVLYRWIFGKELRPTVLHTGQGLLSRRDATVRTRLAFVPGVLRVLAIALLTVVIARPHDLLGRTETSTDGIAIQLVIDRSGSMKELIEYEGRQVQRLDAVKNVVRKFLGGDDRRAQPGRTEVDDQTLTGRPGDLIGLIAFGTFADTVAPLTSDHPPLVELLDTIRVATSTQERSTSIGDALALAVARLVAAERRLEEVEEIAEQDREAARRDRGEPASDESPGADGDGGEDRPALDGKVIILLTDGQNMSGRQTPLEAAAYAQDNGIRVYTIGVGNPSRVVRDMFGRMVRQGGGATVDERTLRRIADATGGRYFYADSGESLREIYAEIDELERTEVTSLEFTQREPRHHAYLALAVALISFETLLAATLFRRAP